MTRSFIPHYFDAGRRARPAMSAESLPNPPRTRTSSLTTFASNTRSSVLPSVLPYLRKLDISSDMSVTKPPLLTLKLSSDSFLDSTITSDATGDELYYIQTDGPVTMISRFDSWEAPTKVIEVKWPKASMTKGKGDEGESILVQVRGGRWKFADSILLSGNSLLSQPKKFQIPGYSRPLKWKQVGNSYWCHAQTVKGPIAILEPGNKSQPARIKVFETLHDKYDARPMLAFNGVSLLLLDYILLTSLLLVIKPLDYTKVRSGSTDTNNSDAPTSVTSASSYPDPLTPQSQHQLPDATVASQWSGAEASSDDLVSHFTERTEKSLPPMPELSSPPLHASTVIITEDADEGVDEAVVGKRGEEAEEQEQEREEEESDNESYPDHDLEIESRHPSRAVSPSAESVYFPSHNGSAPGHTYLDPSFHIPPVPPLPAQYASSVSPISPAISPKRLRQLPIPPPLQGPSSSVSTSNERVPQRSRSTPRDLPADDSDPIFALPSSSTGHGLTRARSMGSRRLPLPPSQSNSLRHDATLRHTQSIHKLQTDVRRVSASSRSLPPTPISAPVHMHADLARIHRSVEQQGDHRLFTETRKDPHGDLLAWTWSSQDERLSLFDNPPPAYNSHNFVKNDEMSQTSSIKQGLS